MHAQTVAGAPTAASVASAVRLPAHLTPAEYAPLAGKSTSAIQRMIARNEFPAGCVVRYGSSKHAKRALLLTARLIEAGWLLPATANP